MKVRRRLLSAAAWTIGGSIAATFVFSGATWQTPWRTIIVQTTANSLFSGCCVTLCTFGLPWVVPRARRWFVFPLDWVAILLTLVAFGAVGSLLAMSIGVLIGVMPSSSLFNGWYPGALRMSLFFTMIFGISGAALTEARARLEKTTLALRTKERDEVEARRLAAEARLASLESRVDPHFLFNTLNSIAALVRENPAGAERMVEQLSALMRSSLDRGASSLVPLEDELSLVRSYLEIERVRFGERLRFRIEPAAGHEAALIPRMSLQTLAENCVKYAVSTSKHGASVAVLAAAQGDRLSVRVEDDGPGFDASHLPDGHGLQLLKARLAMTFDERASLEVESRPGRSVVTLDLPLQTDPPRTPSNDAAPSEPTRDAECR